MGDVTVLPSSRGPCARSQSWLHRLHPSLFVVVFIILVIGVVCVSFLSASLLFVRASSRMETAGVQYAALVSATAAKKIAPFFKYPEDLLRRTARALESPVADNNETIGGGRLNPSGSLDNAAFWVAPQITRDAALFFAVYDNASLNSTIVFPQSLFSPTAQDNVVVARLGPPDSYGQCQGVTSLRPASNPTKAIFTAPYTQNFDFRVRHPYPIIINTSYGSPHSRTPRWYAPCLSYYSDRVVMPIAMPYYDPKRKSEGANLMPSGMETALLFIEAVSRNMHNLTYASSPLLKGSFALMDPSTGAFIGGNFADDGMRVDTVLTNTTHSNGTTVTGMSNIARMASLCEANDPLLRAACAQLGQEMIANCSPAPCTLPFHAPDSSQWILAGLVDTRAIVYVSEIRNDRTGLNLRLVAVTNLDSVMADIANSLAYAIIGGTILAVVVLLVACWTTYNSLAPLRTVEQKMLDAAEAVRSCAGALGTSGGPGSIVAALTEEGERRRSVFAEVDQVLYAYGLLAADLRSVCAFLPLGSAQPKLKSDGSCSTSFDESAEGPESGTAGVSAVLAQTPQSRPSLSHSPATCITSVFLNFPRTHAIVDKLPLQDASRWQGQLISVVLECVERSRGVVESFFGDQFMLSFNASRKCSNHALQATYFIECMHDALMSIIDRSDPDSSPEWHIPTPPRRSASAASLNSMRSSSLNLPTQCSPVVYIGACVGSAVVRQFGSLQGTQIIGSVVTQASSLMRLAKSRRTSVLLSDTMIASLHGLQFQTPSVGQEILQIVQTIIPRLFMHYVAIVRVPFRAAPMLTASLFRSCPNREVCSKQVAGLRARLGEETSTFIDPQTSVEMLLCRSTADISDPGSVVDRSCLCVTIAGLAQANRAMIVYHAGNVQEARVLAQRCTAAHHGAHQLLTRFFYLTGVLKNFDEHQQHCVNEGRY